MAVEITPRARKYVEDYTDGTNLFPFEDMTFLIVNMVDDQLKTLLRKRIEVCGAQLPRSDIRLLAGRS